MSDEVELEVALRIAKELLKRTKAGEIAWQEREGRPFTFETDLSSANVEIGTADNDGVAPFDFRIYSHSDYDLLAVLNSRRNPASLQILSELHASVARRVSGIDSRLQGVLEELGLPLEEPDVPF